MNTRSTRRDFSDDEEPDLNERKQTGSILDELIEQRLRTVIEQNDVHMQQAERFNQIISQYEERIGKIEEKQENLVTSVGRVNGSIVALVERIETIEMRGKAWDLNESKIQAVSAELTTRVQALFTNELKSADISVRRYVGGLEYQNQELLKKIERLENEMLSLKASLTSMTERADIKTNRPTPKEPRISTPMATPMYKSDEDWTHHPLAPSMSAKDSASTSRVGNLVRKPNLYDGQTSWEAYYAQFCIIAEMNGWDDMEKAAFLATSLKGTALQVLANLSNDRRQDYRTLVTALASRFGTSHRTEISKVKFKNRVRQRDEGLPALAEDIERLARLAYADAPPTVIDTLARDQFVDSLRRYAPASPSRKTANLAKSVGVGSRVRIFPPCQSSTKDACFT
jgi:hypothetical protein